MLSNNYANDGEAPPLSNKYPGNPWDHYELKKWTHISNAAIPANRANGHIGNASGTVEDCKTKCTTTTACKSFDYNKTDKVCHLFNKTVNYGQSSLKTDWNGNIYDYYKLQGRNDKF